MAGLLKAHAAAPWGLLSLMPGLFGAAGSTRAVRAERALFAGEAGQVAASSNKVNRHVQASFQTMRFIVTIGWSIYPLGYLFGYLMGSVGESPLNATYNLADFVNKIAFCLAIWAAAKNDTLAKGGH